MKYTKILNNFIYHNGLIKENDKIVMAVSGGIDSMVLSHLLKNYADRRKDNIFLEAVYVQIDEVALADERLNYLHHFFDQLQIRFTVLTGKIYQGVDLNCFICARERRKQLCTYAIESGFDSIAYGHILDDYLETGLMNMIAHGHLESLTPFDTMFDNKIQVIRPLLRFNKKQIYCYARNNGIKEGKHKCGYEHHNMREQVRDLILQQKKIHPVYRKSLRKIINKWNNMNI